jgi:hypothetical protein
MDATTQETNHQGGVFGRSANHDVEKLIGIPKPAAFCNGSRPVRLRNKARPRERITRMSCRSWKCRVCAENLKRNAGQHFGLLLLKSTGMLFGRECVPDEW